MEVKVKKRKRCFGCEKLIPTEEWESGLCLDCMDIYLELNMIVTKYNNKGK